MAIFKNIFGLISGALKTPEAEKSPEFEMIRPIPKPRSEKGMEMPPPVEKMETLLKRSADGFALNVIWMKELEGVRSWVHRISGEREVVLGNSQTNLRALLLSYGHLLQLMGCLEELDEEVLSLAGAPRIDEKKFYQQISAPKYRQTIQQLIQAGLINEASDVLRNPYYWFDRSDSEELQHHQREAVMEVAAAKKQAGQSVQGEYDFLKTRYTSETPQMAAMRVLEGQDSVDHLKARLEKILASPSLREGGGNKKWFQIFEECATALVIASSLDDALDLFRLIPFQQPSEGNRSLLLRREEVLLRIIALSAEKKRAELQGVRLEGKPFRSKGMEDPLAREKMMFDELFRESYSKNGWGLVTEDLVHPFQSLDGPTRVKNLILALAEKRDFEAIRASLQPILAAFTKSGFNPKTELAKILEQINQTVYQKGLIDQGEMNRLGLMFGVFMMGETPQLLPEYGAIQVARSRAVFEKLSLDQWARYLQAFLEKKDHAALHECMRWVEAKEMRPFFSAEDWAEIVRLAKEKPVAAEDPSAV